MNLALPGRLLAAALAVPLVAGCATQPKIRAQSAPGGDVARYRTYGFFEKLGTDQSSYSSLLSQNLKSATAREMESRGLVRRERNPGDQRSFQLFLTEAGKVVHAHAQAILACTHDRLFAPLDAEEQRCMAHLLQRCLDAQEELPQ